MKIFLSFIIIFLLLISVAIPIDSHAMQLQNEAFDRSMIAFGIAKSLNAIISLIQGTELSITPVGLGLTLSVGEVLDPLNDMVERFSWVMLLSTISLGIQKLLLIVSAKLFVQIMLFVSGTVTLGIVWYKKLHQSKFFSYSLKLFILLLFLRFSAVMFIYFSQFTYTTILQNEYEQSLQVVESTKLELQEYQHQNTQKMQQDESFFDSLKKSYDSSLESLNISKQIESLEQKTDKAFGNIVTLITIFVVQSIILPLVYIWLIVLSLKFIFKKELKFDTLKNMYTYNQ
ncbi:hypothetical protein [Sulfurimonas sp.]|uniref:hypothetical protein n=1 Tax=Sulfurimonas sp. TaxID=2022749 RepID=UPI003D098839